MKYCRIKVYFTNTMPVTHTLNDTKIIIKLHETNTPNPRDQLYEWKALTFSIPRLPQKFISNVPIG